MGGLVQNSRAAKYFSKSISYIQDDLTWCVHRADILPAYLNIFRLADLSSCLIYAVLVASSGILLFVYSKTDPQIIHINKNIYYMVLLAALPASGGFAVNRGVLPHRTIFRICFCLILLASFVGLVIFSCFLSSTALHTYRLVQVADVDQLLEQEFDLSSSPASYTIIMDQKKVKKSVDIFLLKTLYAFHSTVFNTNGRFGSYLREH